MVLATIPESRFQFRGLAASAMGKRFADVKIPAMQWRGFWGIVIAAMQWRGFWELSSPPCTGGAFGDGGVSSEFAVGSDNPLAEIAMQMANPMPIAAKDPKSTKRRKAFMIGLP